MTFTVIYLAWSFSSLSASRYTQVGFRTAGPAVCFVGSLD